MLSSGEAVSNYHQTWGGGYCTELMDSLVDRRQVGTRDQTSSWHTTLVMKAQLPWLCDAPRSHAQITSHTRLVISCCGPLSASCLKSFILTHLNINKTMPIPVPLLCAGLGHFWSLYHLPRICTVEVQGPFGW